MLTDAGLMGEDGNLSKNVQEIIKASFMTDEVGEILVEHPCPVMNFKEPHLLAAE